MSQIPDRTWLVIRPSYLVLALTCLLLGIAVIGFGIAVNQWFLLLVGGFLFVLPSLRIAYLGWKRVRLNGERLSVSSPFWFATSLSLAQVTDWELAETDSLEVEATAGASFEGHQPNRAMLYRLARRAIALGRILNRPHGASRQEPVATPLLAVRVWLSSGDRKELLLPYRESLASELETELASLLPSERVAAMDS